MIKHFVVTRLGLGVYHPPYYEGVLRLFEAITYPSLRAQTDQGFTALMVTDRQMPEPASRRLRDILGDAPNFHIVPLDLTGLQQVRHGCWDFIWDRCRDYLIERRLVADPFEYVVTSTLDDDDAWHRSTVDLVNRQFAAELPRLVAGENKRLTNYRHTAGQVLTFPRGLRWFAQSDIVQSFEYEFHSMSVFVLARFSSGISALSSRHPAWPAMAHIAVFEVKKAEPERPMWVYVRHNQAEAVWHDPTEEIPAQPLDKGIAGAVGDPGCVAALRADFGIDFPKVEQWRASQADSRPAHGGFATREQLDCCYRIAALNRQIAVLEHKQRRDGMNERDESFLVKQQRARLELLNRLRQQGRALFA